MKIKDLLTKRTINRQLIVSVITITLVLTAIFSFITINRRINHLTVQVESSIKDKAIVVGRSLENAIWDYDDDLIESIIDAFLMDDGIDGIILDEESGLHSYENTDFQSSEKSLYHKAHTVSLYYEDSYLGDLTLISDIKDEIDIIYLEGLEMMALNLLQAVLIIIMLLILSLRITRPLINMENIAHKIAEGKYDNMIPDARNEEIQLLADSFKKLQDQLLIQRKHINRHIEDLEEKNLVIEGKNKEIEDYNDNLEHLVDERTKELEAANEELLASMEQLKNTQHQLVEMQKTKSISRLIVEIAHRINTPLGSAKLSLSYVEKQLSQLRKAPKDDMNIVQLSQLIKSIQSQINSSCEIINALQLISNTHKLDFKQVHLKAILKLSIEEYESNNPDKLSIKLDNLEGVELSTSPLHLTQMFINLFKYSLKYHSDEKSQNDICISISQDDKHITLEYHDITSLKFSQVGDIIFEPFSLSSFKSDASGLELAIVFNIVTAGLLGHIECLGNEEDKPYFKIYLPKSEP
ncbi:HAMP domain-containing protein [Acidaminobacter sp. JC074]|uniref:HAMP domain-containing protein n=1 Tax=Acidaminobacter sp. JC074 TaxID=2530199 RepID=UPI001F1094FC|nr:HAMP domain-containing protein [Acidaminobacter sp. JC074]MCH4889513.1 HAMP domain-containing protein [Acidaminobacter sp. JC074]